MKIGRKVPPHGGNDKLPGGTPHYETSPQRWVEY